MRRLIALAAVVTLVCAGVALAAEPQKRINAADQARARSMLLKQADVGIGYRALPTPAGGNAFAPNCAALDESGLTVTADAKSPAFTSGLQTFSSVAGLFRTAADANTAWRRTTSAAGFRCLTDVLRKVARAAGLRFVSFRKVPFPVLALRTVAYRWQSQAPNGIRVYADVIAFMRGRAFTTLRLVSGIDPLERDEQLRLARVIAARMAKAMKGA